MRIPRNRADASPRPAGSTRPRSPRPILTEPRQTNLIAPSPPDQIGTTPQNPSETEKSSETDHRRPGRQSNCIEHQLSRRCWPPVRHAQAGIHATAQRCDEIRPTAPGPPAARVIRRRRTALDPHRLDSCLRRNDGTSSSRASPNIQGKRRLPDTADPCYHRLRTGVPFMRIPRNRADASARPAGSTRPRSLRPILTEPRQTDLIAPSPPDQIGTTPQNPSETEKSPQTDHRRPRSPAPRAERGDRIPSPPALRGEMSRSDRGGLRARPHQIGETRRRHFVTPLPAGKVGAVRLTRRSPAERAVTERAVGEPCCIDRLSARSTTTPPGRCTTASQPL